MVGKNHKSAVLVVTDRKSRFNKLRKLDGKHAKKVTRETAKALKGLPIKTMSNDRGQEFSDHQNYEKKSKVKVYFCDPYSSYQRGTNENRIGAIRQYLPKKTDLTNLTNKDLEKIEFQMPTEERDQNMENQACLSILDMATGNQDPRSGRNFNTSGSNGNVFVENMDNVNVSGTTTSLGVFGANIANKNENIRDICIVARNINFSGTIKNSTNAVFVGETGPDDSFIAGINGNNHGELLLKDITVMNI
jgi:hypothetical protein